MVAPQPFFQPRGTPFSVLGRLKALSELGHEVDLLTYHIGEDREIPGVKIHRIPKVPFIKSIGLGPSMKKIVLDAFLLFKTVRFLMKGKYDLLHTHEEASFFGILLARLFGVKHLYDMHSSPTEQLSNFKYTNFKPLIKLFDWIERRVVRSSSAVITICPALEEHVARINGHVPHVMIENVVIDTDPNSIPEEEVRAFAARHPAIEGKRVIFYAGTFEAYQGIDLLVESAKKVVEKCPDALFLMVGGKPGQVKLYQEQAHSLGLSRSFYFTGTRPPSEIPLFMRLSDVLVSPRTGGTNTPLKIYSYLQSGKPIVATDLYTHTQVLNDKVSVLAKPEAGAFADGIISVLQSTELAASLGKNAMQLFEASYSFGTYVQKTDSVLHMALG